MRVLAYICMLIPHPRLERARCINRSAVSNRPLAHIHTESKMDVATIIITHLFPHLFFGYITIIIYSTIHTMFS